MSIIIIDQSPELFGFVSNSLMTDEIPLMHFKTALTDEKFILQELPEFVIINGYDKTIDLIFTYTVKQSPHLLENCYKIDTLLS